MQFRNRFRAGLIALICPLVLCTACSMKRDISVSVPDKVSGTEEPSEAAVYKFEDIKNEDIDFDKISSQFVGNGAKRTKTEDPNHSTCEKDGCHLEIGPEYGDDNYILEFFMGFWNVNANMGSCYESIVHGYYGNEQYNFLGLHNENLRGLFPKESLESVSKEDAIAFCSPYADSLGYDGSNVQVYALGVEELRQAAGSWDRNYEPGDEVYKGAPDPECVPTFREGASNARNDIEWQKKDEAFFMVYRFNAGEYIVDQEELSMVLVYVPAVKSIVYASGSLPIKVQENETENIITSGKAVSNIMIHEGITDFDNVDLKEIKIEYSADMQTFYHKRVLYPYWRVVYRIKGIKQENDLYITARVNAITGEIMEEVGT